VWGLERPITDGVQGGAESLLGAACAGLLGGGVNRIGEVFVALGDERGHQLVARAEVAVQRRAGHAHRLRDAVEGERRGSALGDLRVGVLADFGQRLGAQTLAT
jgi:hypothetical protein